MTYNVFGGTLKLTQPSICRIYVIFLVTKGTNKTYKVVNNQCNIQ